MAVMKPESTKDFKEASAQLILKNQEIFWVDDFKRELTEFTLHDLTTGNPTLNCSSDHLANIFTFERNNFEIQKEQAKII